MSIIKLTDEQVTQLIGIQVCNGHPELVFKPEKGSKYRFGAANISDLLQLTPDCWRDDGADWLRRMKKFSETTPSPEWWTCKSCNTDRMTFAQLVGHCQKHHAYHLADAVQSWTLVHDSAKGGPDTIWEWRIDVPWSGETFILTHNIHCPRSADILCSRD